MEISVHQGLAELKLLEKRIARAIQSPVFAAYAVGKNPVNGFASTEEFEKHVKSSFQSVKDLIERRKAIKSAITKSNALTEIEVGGVIMTVAEALDRKNNIQSDKDLLRKLKQDLAQATAAVERENSKVQARLDSYLLALYGSEKKVKEADTSATTAAFKEDNEAKLIDPLGLREVIEKLEKEIEDFETQVDFRLSEINTITKITVPDTVA
jgi:hypothetical protein